MNPFLFLFLAIITPFLLLATLLVPPYIGVIGALFVVYGGKAEVLLDQWYDPFYTIDFYTKLFNYWHANMHALSLVHYALPIIGLPLIGLLLGLWLTRRIARKMKDIFHLSLISN